MSDVKIVLDANLDKIKQSLGSLNTMISGVGNNIKKQGNLLESTYEDGFRQSTKQAENFMARLGGLGKRTLKNLGDDFKALGSLNAIRESLKMSDKFRDRIMQTMTLNDAIRKMGASFGVAQNNFGKFQTALQKGLGDVGLSGEAAANALEGLMGTQVKGEQDVLRFAKQAGMIAALSGETGQEAAISKGIADISLKGFSPEQIGTTLSRMQMGAGMKGTESVALMKDVLTEMTPEQIKGMGGLKGIEDLAIIMQKSGKESADFFKKFMSATFPGRQVLEAQGAKGIFGEKGFNASAFKKFIDKLKERSVDPKFALTTAGMSEENATAFLKLADSLDQVKKQTDMVNQSFVSTEESLVKNRGFAESFSAAINRVFGNIDIGKVTQPLTEMFSQLASSDVGSAAMVAGSAIVAAVLAGIGMKGAGKALGLPGLLKGGSAGAGVPTAGGYVDPYGGYGSYNAPGKKMGVMGMLGKAGMAAGAALGGWEIGTAIGEAIEPGITAWLDKNTSKQTDEGIGEANIAERALLKLMRVTGLGLDEQTLSNLNRSEAMVKRGDIKITMVDPRLKEVHSPTRGGSFE